MDLPSFATSQKLALAGGGLLIAGAALPWTPTSDAVAFVLRGDQFVGLLAGVSVVGIVLVREWSMLEWFGVALFGVVTTYFGLRALQLLLGAGYGIGAGLPVQLLGGLLAVAGGAYATRDVIVVGDEPDGGEEGATDDDARGDAE